MGFVKFAIFYGSYLYLPFVVGIVWWLLARPRSKNRWIMALGVLTLSSCVAYGRFIEPRLLFTPETKIKVCTHAEVSGEVRIAVFADSHNGMFPNAISMARIVSRVVETKPDFVLIPGDFTYHPQFDQLETLFAPLKDLQMPVYLVMGNHDEGLPGPFYSDELARIFKSWGLNVLDYGTARFIKGELSVRIVGFTDLWASYDEPTAGPIVTDPYKEAIIYLQHNPDMLEEISPLGKFDLFVAGHTHGGQIYLPFITCAFTLACDTHRYGFLQHREGPLFVTSGTGMVGLPMRFAVPPRIDVLNVQFEDCSADAKG